MSKHVGPLRMVGGSMLTPTEPSCHAAAELMTGVDVQYLEDFSRLVPGECPTACVGGRGRQLLRTGADLF